MTDDNKHITAEECAQEVKLMARRAALLHYYFAETMIDAFGEEEGRKMIKRAVWAYGEHCGRAVREGVEAMGLPNTPENFDKVADLPHFGWETSSVTLPGGEVRPIATFCPLAATFKEFGDRGEELGRIYCFVDQAKYHAYNPDFEFIHTKNVLDGDPYCEFLVRPLTREES